MALRCACVVCCLHGSNAPSPESLACCPVVRQHKAVGLSQGKLLLLARLSPRSCFPVVLVMTLRCAAGSDRRDRVPVCESEVHRVAHPQQPVPARTPIRRVSRKPHHSVDWRLQSVHKSVPVLSCSGSVTAQRASRLPSARGEVASVAAAAQQLHLASLFHGPGAGTRTGRPRRSHEPGMSACLLACSDCARRSSLVGCGRLSVSKWVR